jgi:hypothetical protein
VRKTEEAWVGLTEERRFGKSNLRRKTNRERNFAIGSLAAATLYYPSCLRRNRRYNL